MCNWITSWHKSLCDRGIYVRSEKDHLACGCWLSKRQQLKKLVSWCFEPSQPQRITSGLNTNFTLSPSYTFRKSSYQKSCFFGLFIFCGHSTREPASSRVTHFILQAYTGTGVSHSQHRKKIGRGFGINAGEWTGRVEISNEEIPGSKRSMYGYIPTYSRL